MMQERKAGTRQIALAMVGVLMLAAGLMLAGLPGESAAKTCQLQLSGPLAGACALR